MTKSSSHVKVVVYRSINGGCYTITKEESMADRRK